MSEEEQSAEEKVRELVWCRGYVQALRDYAIWKDGVPRIGCLERPIKEIILDLADKHNIGVEHL